MKICQMQRKEKSTIRTDSMALRQPTSATLISTKQMTSSPNFSPAIPSNTMMMISSAPSSAAGTKAAINKVDLGEVGSEDLEGSVVAVLDQCSTMISSRAAAGEAVSLPHLFPAVSEAA